MTLHYRFVWARSVAPLVDAELKSELAPGGVSPIDAGNLVRRVVSWDVM